MYEMVRRQAGSPTPASVQRERQEELGKQQKPESIRTRRTKPKYATEGPRTDKSGAGYRTADIDENTGWSIHGPRGLKKEADNNRGPCSETTI